MEASMSWDTVQVTEFNARLDIQEQQMNSRLTPYATRQTITGDDFAWDGLGEVQPYRANGRNPDVNPTQSAFNRRKMSRERVVVSLLIDSKDVRGMLTNPQGDLAKMCIAAVERETDRVIYDALFASVSTGRNFATTVTAASDGVIEVDATTAFTYEKLLEIKANFMDNEVGNDMAIPVAIGVTGDEHTDLMSEIELTSNDYTNQMAIEQGAIKQALGMSLVAFGANATDPILEVSTYRYSFALAKGGVVLGISQDRKVEIKDYPSKVETTLINVIKELGAVRTQGVRVQKIKLTA
jgi:hypothetical protein